MANRKRQKHVLVSKSWCGYASLAHYMIWDVSDVMICQYWRGISFEYALVFVNIKNIQKCWIWPWIGCDYYYFAPYFAHLFAIEASAQTVLECLRIINGADFGVAILPNIAENMVYLFTSEEYNESEHGLSTFISSMPHVFAGIYIELWFHGSGKLRMNVNWNASCECI